MEGVVCPVHGERRLYDWGKVGRVNPGLGNVIFPHLCACERSLPTRYPVVVSESRERGGTGSGPGGRWAHTVIWTVSCCA